MGGQLRGGHGLIVWCGCEAFPLQACACTLKWGSACLCLGVFGVWTFLGRRRRLQHWRLWEDVGLAGRDLPWQHYQHPALPRGAPPACPRLLAAAGSRGGADSSGKFMLLILPLMPTSGSTLK